jgi:hypothetical protein
VNDEDLLAEQIARVALGQSRQVARILNGAGLASLTSASSNAYNNAVKMLTVAAGADPYHRDGWIFQVMSWIAAYRATPNSIIRPPHMILAHKGFDGLQLIIDDSDGSIEAAVIFEDKATENPRTTIRDEVWPDFEMLEKGDRENVLTADATAALSGYPGIDTDKAIEKIVWEQVRRYRVSITVSNTHNSDVGRRRLFKDYDTIVQGDISRRRSETFFSTDLRPWMALMANKAITAVRSIESADV